MRYFYELHFLLLLLKSGNINFTDFLARAKEWAEEMQKQSNRPKR